MLSTHVHAQVAMRLDWMHVVAGHAASVLLMTVYIVALHNNSVFLLVLGLPFDRALPWHKMLAVSAMFNALIHQAAFYVGGRNNTMVYARDASHHIFKHVTKAYGMEITGAMQPACVGQRG
jgi:L-arabinose isomerase